MQDVFNPLIGLSDKLYEKTASIGSYKKAWLLSPLPIQKLPAFISHRLYKKSLFDRCGFDGEPETDKFRVVAEFCWQRQVINILRTFISAFG